MSTRSTPVCHSITVGRTIRFQVLHRHCIRIEEAVKGRFTDEATIFARERHQPRAVEFTLTRKGRTLIIDTGAIELRCLDDGRPLGPKNLSARIRCDGKWVEWRPGQANPGNLGGTAETLDGWNGPQELPPGLLSRDGWFLLDDSATPVLTESGWVRSRDQASTRDWYLFGYGRDFRAAFQAFAAVSGPASLPRRYCLGAWYSRYWPYSADDFRQLVKEYRQKDFPLDIMVMDMDWHINDPRRAPGAKVVMVGPLGSQVWTGYTWDRKLLPDPKGLLAWLHEQKIAVTLNDHPADGVQPHEKGYRAFMREYGADAKSGQIIPFDAGNQRYMDLFYRHTHVPLEKDGVDFWWLDWQQERQIRSLPELTNLRWLNYFYYERSQEHGRRGASFSRFGGWGDHRHPIHFSGDAYTNWETLAFEVPFTATAGNVGCFFWSHDIGGHMGGRNEESYTRWCQFGAFSAALRSHSTRDKDMDRRPWCYDKWAEDSMRRSFHLRSEFFPYLYSCAAQACRDTVPMLRPMYIDYAEIEAAYHQPQQYLFGDHLLVAPVVEPGVGPRRLATQAVWFPPGIWYNIFTGERFTGPCEQMVAADIDEFPLYARGGAPIPTQPYTPRMAGEPLRHLVLRVWPGAEGETQTTELIEDDGQTMAYAAGERAVTPLACTRQGDTFTLSLGATIGSYQGQPEKRRLTIELHEVEKPVRVTLAGRPVVAEYNKANRTLRIEAKELSIRSACTIVVQAAVADCALATVEAFVRRAGLPKGRRQATLARRFAEGIGRKDALQQQLALRAVGIGFLAKHETAYGFPAEPEFFVYAPAGFAVKPEVTLQVGSEVSARLSLAGEKTVVEVLALLKKMSPLADELMVLHAPIPVSATLTVNGRKILCGREIKLEKPWWPFRRNLAPQAKATASSATDCQPPCAAIDGVVDGLPGDNRREWASVREKTGAWLKLEWPEPVTIGRVLLFDRPNVADHILAGRIILDDGSTFAVGELPTDAKTPFEVRFSPRPTRWLLFVVTEVTPATEWTGLAEIAVY